MLRCFLCLLLFGAVHAAPNEEPFPKPDSIKGLQVQMTEDALELGVRHAAININLSGVSDAYLAALDRQIRPLSEKGVVVYAILIAYPGGDERVLHPAARGGKAGFTVAGFEAGERLRTVCQQMAERWSGAHPEHGRVWGWIVGNEVNSHGMWYHVGRQPLAGVVGEYEKAFRVVHEAVRKASVNARLYVPFDHHWTARMGTDAELAAPGRDFLGAFAAQVRERGDLDWHVAWHPYGSDLGNPRIWADTEPTEREDTPKVTFKNLEVLCRYLERPELRWQGKARRVILSEQGFHTLATADGPALQAAAYVYAWEKCQGLPLVDAFIYHRHVDHAQEGGLALGLWTRKPETVASPFERKPIYEVLKAAGTGRWAEVSGFAKGVVGPN